MTIRSFRDSATEVLFYGRRTSRVRRFPPDVVKIALRKLDVLNGAHRLSDLKAPPANRLEALKGDLAGFHSIRVNDHGNRLILGGRNDWGIGNWRGTPPHIAAIHRTNVTILTMSH